MVLTPEVQQATLPPDPEVRAITDQGNGGEETIDPRLAPPALQAELLRRIASEIRAARDGPFRPLSQEPVVRHRRGLSRMAARPRAVRPVGTRTLPPEQQHLDGHPDRPQMRKRPEKECQWDLRTYGRGSDGWSILDSILLGRAMLTRSELVAVMPGAAGVADPIK